MLLGIYTTRRKQWDTTTNLPQLVKPRRISGCHPPPIIGGAIFFGHKRDDVLYLKVKIDGTDTKRIVKGHSKPICRDCASYFSITVYFSLLKWGASLLSFTGQVMGINQIQVIEDFVQFLRIGVPKLFGNRVFFLSTKNGGVSKNNKYISPNNGWVWSIWGWKLGLCWGNWFLYLGNLCFTFEGLIVAWGGGVVKRMEMDFPSNILKGIAIDILSHKKPTVLDLQTLL